MRVILKPSDNHRGSSLVRGSSGLGMAHLPDLSSLQWLELMITDATFFITRVPFGNIREGITLLSSV